jgi:hypothetical protein
MDAHSVDKACGQYGADERACTVGGAVSANAAHAHGSHGAQSG